MKTILVGAALANRPFNGGGAWVRLSWIKGLRRLGFRVFFIEQILPEACVDSAGKHAPFVESVNYAFFRDIVAQYGLAESSALVLGNGEETLGTDYRSLIDIASSADLLLNISGHISLSPLMHGPRKRLYLDIDPGFTQFWHADGNPGSRLAGHDYFYTIGENIGQSECKVPTSGINWRTTRQPVVLDDWKCESPLPSKDHGMRRFTTIAAWRGPFGPISVGSQTLGLKLHQFRKFFDMPQRVDAAFELALKIHPAEVNDLAALAEKGWCLVDPAVVAGTPQAFRQYIFDSDAEFSAAQGVYVDTRCGWFSDRSVRYLAAGKPVVVQDTGLQKLLPTGNGLLTFSTLEEARLAVESIKNNYAAHSAAAANIARDCFDSDRVIGKMMDELDIVY
jgi:hypothetical protein